MAHMENQTSNPSAGRRAAVSALAIVGFIVLIIIGIGLAIYTARYLPDLSSRVGGGAVSLSSIFHHKPNGTALQVVTSTTTLPFAETSTTTSTSSLSANVTASSSSAAPSHAGSSPKPHAGTGTVTKYITVTTTTTVQPHGNPDLTVVISQVGYLATRGDTSSFVGSKDIPSGKDGAVRFTVTNVGTNVSGEWKFSADLPGQPTFTSPYQRSLGPDDNADFILGFTHSHSGDDRLITITVDPSDRIIESNENNNSATATVDIR